MFTEPLDVMRTFSAPAVPILRKSPLCSYCKYPLYSASPDVPSEYAMVPKLPVPERIVIPVFPVVATVKSSALGYPSVVVPKSNRPVDVMRSISLP